MEMSAIQAGIAGLCGASAVLPAFAQMSVTDGGAVAGNLATRGTPYVLAAVIVVLGWTLYQVFGLFLKKIQEREDDLKTCIKENTAAINRMVDHCGRSKL